MASEKKPVRVYCDGCFDLTHYGHFNALRQAKELGDVLVVGVHSDAEIKRNKGPPVLNEDERYTAIRQCKWVDELVEDAPYSCTVEFMDKHNIDFIVHGEDITVNADGVDAYHEVKASGRFRTIKRTDGVSSTDLVGRMLLLTKNHLADERSSALAQKLPFHSSSLSTMTTSRVLSAFTSSCHPKPTDRIIYMDGAFDLFHAGHVKTLQAAKARGDYLIVGIHEDVVVNAYKGANYPIMNLFERVLSVLSCRYVDEVFIGAPFFIEKDFLEKMKVSEVIHGTDSIPDFPGDSRDPYGAAKEMGIYHTITSVSSLSTTVLVERIIDNWAAFAKRNLKKTGREKDVVEKGQAEKLESDQ
eukprot:CAMPEP_0113901042 /NCGR_PEP_ID=MMETSP0780_2-20120614/21025_1 /TAXON_ID=652834 /ORGANISM="Palpitomonas bilix" /LENGTH=356 /DNA_ID=CAMNT_0000893593 /DNA_START=105 /DNA_END=1175 /DNA_ORIENTATION=- /assembly_acc=CAM_ASM_000599